MKRLFNFNPALFGSVRFEKKKSFAAMETLRGLGQITYYELAINYGFLIYNIDQDASIGALGTLGFYR